MIVYSTDRQEKVEKNKNKTQVVLCGPALQVSPCPVVIDDVVIFVCPLFDLSPGILLCVHFHIVKEMICQSEKTLFPLVSSDSPFSFFYKRMQQMLHASRCPSALLECIFVKKRVARRRVDARSPHPAAGAQHNRGLTSWCRWFHHSNISRGTSASSRPRDPRDPAAAGGGQRVLCLCAASFSEQKSTECILLTVREAGGARGAS